jgi:hypothetical protein
MFLCAVARPRYNETTGEWFDGRIGLWPFANYVPAIRSSKNRAAGTLELKSIAVDHQSYRDMLVHNVIPAIKQRWPGTKNVFIQQDNARPHISSSDPVFREKATEDGWNIVLTYQPAQSPDFNVLDLGFFHSIQSLQYKKRSKNLAELLGNVEQAFKELSSDTLDNTFLTLQKCMEASIAVGGGNNYKLPRMHKEQLRRQGILPKTFFCDPAAYDNAVKGILPKTFFCDPAAYDNAVIELTN